MPIGDAWQRDSERRRAWKGLSASQRADYRRAYFLGRAAKDPETARAVVLAARLMPAWYWAFATLAAAGLAVGAATQRDWFFFTALAVVFVSSAFFWWTRPRVLRANLPVAEDLD